MCTWDRENIKNVLSKAALIGADSNVDINDFFYTPQVNRIMSLHYTNIHWQTYYFSWQGGQESLIKTKWTQFNVCMI